VETTQAVATLVARAQDNRLDVFGLLVRAGPQGMSAGHVAEALGLAPNTLTFSFWPAASGRNGADGARGTVDDLRHSIRDHELFDHLSENCCGAWVFGHPRLVKSQNTGRKPA